MKSTKSGEKGFRSCDSLNVATDGRLPHSSSPAEELRARASLGSKSGEDTAPGLPTTMKTRLTWQ